MINGSPSSSGGSGQQQSTQAPTYSGIRPPTITATQSSTPNGEILFRQLTPDLPENFSAIMKRTFQGDTGTRDFPDDKLRGKKAIRLIPLEDNQVCRLVIYSELIEPQIDALETAFLLHESKDGRYRRQMWKYANLFDITFLKPIQTKSCSRFVFILACILKNDSPAAISRILEIKQFEKFSQSDRRGWKMDQDY
ncbi:hypothetical protein LR48_Vigan01g053600 [Vigna angularis]|uniref:Uncharacterized protein n=1 Tax=Phaseolus angularis TaxID=3914 RepID=A0A0L9TKI2_PHAAN|nr:hypothetical protein LR48_Vigan01g053600 [Vigna angularis]